MESQLGVRQYHGTWKMRQRCLLCQGSALRYLIRGLLPWDHLRRNVLNLCGIGSSFHRSRPGHLPQPKLCR